MMSSSQAGRTRALACHYGRAVTTWPSSDKHHAPYASRELLTTTLRPVQGGLDRSCDHAELAVEEHLFQPMNKQMCEGYTTQLRGSLTAVYVIPTTPAASAIRSNRAPKCFTGAAPLTSGGVQLPVLFHCQLGSGRGRHDKANLVRPASSFGMTGL